MGATPGGAHDGVEIGIDFRAGVGHCTQRLDTVTRLGTLLGLGAAQIVEAAASVSFKIQETLVFTLQRADQGQQGDVFVHIGEITGMKTVTIFHLQARGSG